MNPKRQAFSDYCLRHLPFHLSSAGYTPKIYTLARNANYSSQQRDRFPSEPGISVSSQRLALIAAAKEDDPVNVAEFCLRHLTSLLEIQAESPLAAVRSGRLERAWELADYAEADIRTLWYILIAWHLMATRDYVNATTTLIRLMNLPISTIDPGRFLDQENWKNVLALFLLEVIGYYDRKSALEIADVLLPEYQVKEVSEKIDQGRKEKPALSTSSFDDRREEIEARAIRFATEGQIENANDALKEIPLDGYGFQTNAYIKVMRHLIAMEQETDACLLAAGALQPFEEYEQVESFRLQSLAEIGRIAILDGHTQKGRDFLSIAQEQATLIKDAQLKFQACSKIAYEWARIKDIDSAFNCIHTVMGPDDELAQAWIFVGLTGILAEVGKIEDALSLVKKIPEPYWWKSFRNEALGAVARSLAQQGEFERAFNVANSIEIRAFVSDVESVSWAERAEAFGPIARVQAEAGDLDGAMMALKELLNIGGITDPGPASRFSNQVWRTAETVFLCSIEHGLVTEANYAANILRSHNFASEHDLNLIDEILRQVFHQQSDYDITRTLEIKDAGWRILTLSKVGTAIAKDNLSTGLLHQIINIALDSVEEIDSFWFRLELLQQISELEKHLPNRLLLTKTIESFVRATNILPNDPENALHSVLINSLSIANLDMCSDILVEAAQWVKPAYQLCSIVANRNTHCWLRVGELIKTLRWIPTAEI